jgi:serine/threonine protein kinase
VAGNPAYPTFNHFFDSPSDEQGHTKLPDYVQFKVYPKTPLRMLFSAAKDDALDLLGKTLAYDPSKRITAREVCGSLNLCNIDLIDVRPWLTPIFATHRDQRFRKSFRGQQRPKKKK